MSAQIISTDPRGATADDWFSFDFVLGLGENLLPCVPAGPDVRVVADSALEGKIGKIPSAYNHNSEAHGIKDWQKKPILSNEIQLWSADRRLNLCVRLGAISGVYAIDVDVDDHRADYILQELTRILLPSGGELPRRTRSNSKKFLVAVRVTGSPSIKKRRLALDQKPRGPAIELLADGNQFVACGTHSSGVRYEWLPSLPSELPEVTLDQLDEVWALLETLAPEKIARVPLTATNTSASSSEGVLTEISDGDWADLRDALRYLAPHSGDNDRWAHVGIALLSIKDCGKPVRQLWLDFSKKAPNWQEGAAEDWWDAHTNQQPRSDFRHVFTMARQLGWRTHSDPAVFDVVTADTAPAVVTPEPAMAPLPESFVLNSDLMNAHRLHARYGSTLLVISGRFHHYTGTHWEKDEAFIRRAGGELAAMVREEVEAARAQAEALIAGKPADVQEAVQKTEATKRLDKSKARDSLRATHPDIVRALDKAEVLKKWAEACESRSRQHDAVELLRGMCDYDPLKLDRDPHLLNCLSGTIDLRTGELRPHSPFDFITKCAPVKYDPDAKAPRFETFLAEIMGNSEERVGFLRRWFGYAATGEVFEQKVVFHVGPGGGGKGTLLRAVSDVLGKGYTCTAARGLLTGHSEDRHPTEIMDLFGARLVTAHESDEGADLREGFLKQLTGEDSLKGRAMRQDFIEFAPTLKLQLLTNYPPVIKGSDYGIWRRLVLVPYEVKFGTPEDVAAGKATRPVDPTLPEALRAERDGIFAWLVRGAVEWYRTGLRVPESIRRATDLYQGEQDRAEQFVADRCVKDPKAWASVTELHNTYALWCHERGYKPLGWAKLVVELRRIVGPTFAQHNTRSGQGSNRRTVRGYNGLGITSMFDPVEDQPTPLSVGDADKKMAVSAEGLT